MSEKQHTPAVIDAGVLIHEAPTIEIAGTKYVVRPLVFMDAMVLSRILAKAIGVIGHLSASEKVKTLVAQVKATFTDKDSSESRQEKLSEVLGSHIFDLIPIVGEELLDWLVTTLVVPVPDEGETACRQLAPEEWKGNPFKFPLGSEIKVVNKLLKGPEIETFIDGVRALMRDPELRKWGEKMGAKVVSQISSEESKESRPDTDGA